VKFELHTDLSEENLGFHFLRLTPIWALITFLFVVVLQKRGLQQEIDKLAYVNEKLKQGTSDPGEPQEDILFVSGKKEMMIEPGTISHISVEDHYCYVYQISSDENQTKIDISQPLRKLEKLLPKNFIKVHRSHIVNLEHVTKIEKTERNYSLLLLGESFRIPISRSRLQKTLPVLERLLNLDATRVNKAPEVTL